MKAHLARVHGLVSDLPGPSQREWVHGQVQSLADKYAQAKLDGDDQEASRIYGRLTKLYYNHQDILTLDSISRALKERRRRLEGHSK